MLSYKNELMELLFLFVLTCNGVKLEQMRSYALLRLKQTHVRLFLILQLGVLLQLASSASALISPAEEAETSSEWASQPRTEEGGER